MLVTSFIVRAGMFTTLLISLREFLEAFLIVGVFLGISKKLNLKKEVEIGLAAFTGIAASFLLAGATFALGDAARTVLTEERAELLESYLLIFSGLFLAYVVFSLHKRISENKKHIIEKTSAQLGKQVFDFSLFATITLLVAREGFEIALFTASTSLFSVFFQNIFGLFIGFCLAAIAGVFAFAAYTKFHINKVFRYTEYMIILLGAAMVQVGLTELLEHQLGFHLSDIASFGMSFLPAEDTVVGHFLQSFTGIDQEFSLPRLCIMIVYIAGIYLLFGQRKRKELTK